MGHAVGVNPSKYEGKLPSHLALSKTGANAKVGRNAVVNGIDGRLSLKTICRRINDSP